MKNVVSFSGGQTSGRMLRMLMDKHGASFDRDFMVVFENTGKEHDATLEFVHEVETRWSVDVVWLEYTRVPASEVDPIKVPEGRTRTNLLKRQEQGAKTHWWKRVNYETAARRMDPLTPFDILLEWANILPNVRTRMCSVQLKVRTRDRFLRSLGIQEFNSFIGIRKDEEHRVLEILANIDKYEKPQFPLVEAGTTRTEVDAFWMEQSFRLMIPNYMGNCDMCFLKARQKRIQFVKNDSAGAEWWANWEAKKALTTTGDGRYFDRRTPVTAFIEAAKQPELGLVYELDDQDVPCTCSIGGYRQKANEAEEEVA